MRNIRQNLFFTFVYNTLGIPFAAGSLYPCFNILRSPMIAAAAMSLSSVSVIENLLQPRKIAIKPQLPGGGKSVTDKPVETQPWRCLFCRMHTGIRLFRISVCHICRDQVQDFVWVSGIQGALVAAGFISGVQFVVEEVLLFGVLLLVKHRLSSIFDRFVQSV